VVTILVLGGPAIAGDLIRLEAKLQNAAGIHNDRFGAAVDIAGDLLVVGAPRAGVDGEAYIFRRTGTDGSQEATLLPSGVGGPSGGRFGAAVAVSDHAIAVGAPWEPTGSVYVFVRDATGWVKQVRLAPHSLASGDQLGTSIALDGTTLVAGAPSGAPAAAPPSGRAGRLRPHRLGALTTGNHFGAAVNLDSSLSDAVEFTVGP
jgi:hypothetical protein